MQSEKPQIHTLHHSVSTVCRTIMDCYITNEHLRKTAVANVQYRDPSNFVLLNEIYLGPKVAAAVTNNTHGLSKQNQKRCLSFLIESVRQISMRFPFRELILKNLSFIDPKEVKSRNVVSIGPLASVFPGIVGPDKINYQDREWRVLRNTDLADSEISVSRFVKFCFWAIVPSSF